MPDDQNQTTKPDILDRAIGVLRGSDVLYHVQCVERALEDAQSCIRGETPEEGAHEEATLDAIDAVRAALLKHLPEIKKAMLPMREAIKDQVIIECLAAELAKLKGLASHG